MKISILAPDLSHNCLGRAYLLAKILQRHYEVEVIGPVFGDGIWEPVADDKSVIYKFVKIYGKFKPYWQIKNLIKTIEGDVIYASKPLFSSFGIGLLKKISSKRPLILDIDDWEMGAMKEYYRLLSFTYRIKALAYAALYPYSINSYWNNLFGEKLVYFVDEVTVSNRFLQRKYGGTIVWHGRDTKSFNPEKFNQNLVREKYGIDNNKKVIMFFGTPRPHKGLEELIEALSRIQDRNVILTLVGVNEDNYSKNLVKTGREILGGRFKAFGLQPFQKVPEFLAMSDVVVIPQKRNFVSMGQIPAKIFDAMAMAKPIIATNISDLPEILNGCGWIVEPENQEQLAETIQYVLNNPEEAKEKGWQARQRCIEKYSWDALEKVLVKVFEKFE